MKCVKCKDNYKEKANIVKIGKYFCEVYNDNNGYDLCKWCLYSLNEVDSNIFYNIDGR